MGMTEEKYNILVDFSKFVKLKLGIHKMPIIIFKNKRDGMKTTANYDYNKEEKVIKIFSGNRHVVDIMRSLAHELVHHKQFEDGKLKTKPPDIGGVIEDDANAKAGQLIKLYALKNNNIYDE